MRTFISILLLCCIGLLPVHAEHATFSRKEGFFSLRDTLTVYFFNTSTHRLIVRDEGDMSTPRFGSLDSAMRKSPCVAGVNGGYFSADASGSPLGIVVQNGKQISPLAVGSFAVSGIVYRDASGAMVLMRSKAFKALSPRPTLVSALQGGPFLVENGKVVNGLNASKSTYRTFIATDGKNNWCIGISSSLSLRELASWLATPGALGNFRVHKAMNLDGGSSSGYWCHEKGVYDSPVKKVRNYLGVAPLSPRR